MEIVFDVAEPNWAKFVALFKRVSSKVERLGFAPLTYETGEPYPVTVDGVRYAGREVTVTAQDAEANGWVLTGRLEHLMGEDAIVHGDVPPAFRELGPVCHHCECKRHRNLTYLVRNQATKQRMLVGKSCLGDFLTMHSPDGLVRYFDQLAQLEEEAAQLKECSGGGVSYQHVLYDAKEALTTAACLIKQFGWVSSEQANRNRTTSTGWRVRDAISQERKRWEEWVEAQADKVLRERVEKVLEWLLSSEVEDAALESPYLHSLRAIAKCGMLPWGAFGLWVSAFQAYDYAQKKKEEPTLGVSAPVGKRGERGDFLVTLTGTTPLESAYGPKTLHRLRDANGNQLVWFAVGGAKMRVGEKYHITGKVEKHDLYRDRWQTTLSRVTVHDMKLHEAVEAHDLKKLKKALKAGYFVDVRDDWGRTPLFRAVQLGEADACELLLEADADPNAVDLGNLAVLEPACAQGNLGVVKKLLDAGAIVTTKALQHIPPDAADVRQLAEAAMQP